MRDPNWNLVSEMHIVHTKLAVNDLIYVRHVGSSSLSSGHPGQSIRIVPNSELEILTLTIPEPIWDNASRLSHNGYKTTANALMNVQIIPITTHAVSPPVPYTVDAKKRGKGIKMMRIRSCGMR